MTVLVGAFSCVILLLVTVIILILCRKKILRGSSGKGAKGKKNVGTAAAAATNNLIVANNLNHFAQDDDPSDTSLKPESPSASNEADSAWEGSDDQNDFGFGGRVSMDQQRVVALAGPEGPLQGTHLLPREGGDPDFPPKPVSQR